MGNGRWGAPLCGGIAILDVARLDGPCAKAMVSGRLGHMQDRAPYRFGSQRPDPLLSLAPRPWCRTTKECNQQAKTAESGVTSQTRHDGRFGGVAHRPHADSVTLEYCPSINGLGWDRGSGGGDVLNRIFGGLRISWRKRRRSTVE